MRLSMQLGCRLENWMFRYQMLLRGERGGALFFAEFELWRTPPLPQPPVSVRVDKFQSHPNCSCFYLFDILTLYSIKIIYNLLLEASAAERSIAIDKTLNTDCVIGTFVL